MAGHIWRKLPWLKSGAGRTFWELAYVGCASLPSWRRPYAILTQQIHGPRLACTFMMLASKRCLGVILRLQRICWLSVLQEVISHQPTASLITERIAIYAIDEFVEILGFATGINSSSRDRDQYIPRWVWKGDLARKLMGQMRRSPLQIFSTAARLLCKAEALDWRQWYRGSKTMAKRIVPRPKSVREGSNSSSSAILRNLQLELSLQGKQFLCVGIRRLRSVAVVIEIVCHPSSSDSSWYHRISRRLSTACGICPQPSHEMRLSWKWRQA